MPNIRRGAAAVGLAAALTVGPLSATAFAQETGSAGGNATSSATSGTATSANGGGAAAGSAAISVASCSGASCFVTLAGDGSKVEVFGATISLRGLQDGQAALRVGDQDVFCRPGQRISLGSLRLACTAIAANSVEFTVSVS
jgi:hypothetical protein